MGESTGNGCRFNEKGILQRGDVTWLQRGGRLTTAAAGSGLCWASGVGTVVFLGASGPAGALVGIGVAIVYDLAIQPWLFLQGTSTDELNSVLRNRDKDLRPIFSPHPQALPPSSLGRQSHAVAVVKTTPAQGTEHVPPLTV